MDREPYRQGANDTLIEDLEEKLNDTLTKIGAILEEIEDLQEEHEYLQDVASSAWDMLHNLKRDRI